MVPMAQWVKQQSSEALVGFESLNLPLIFHFTKMILNFEDCFFLTPIKINNFRQILVGAA